MFRLHRFFSITDWGNLGRLTNGGCGKMLLKLCGLKSSACMYIVVKVWTNCVHFVSVKRLTQFPYNCFVDTSLQHYHFKAHSVS